MSSAKVKISPTEWIYISVGPKGEDGIDGTDGIDGIDGTDGRTILNGTGAPDNSLGMDGDLYIDTTNAVFYGPKASGAWPAGNNILLGAGAKRITVGTTPPSSPTPGDLWVDTT